MARRRGRQHAGQGLKDSLRQGSGAYQPMAGAGFEPPLPWSEPDDQPAQPQGTLGAGPNVRQLSLPYMGLLIVSLVAILAMAAFVLRVASARAGFAQRKALLNQTAFFDGIQVDGIPLAGLSPAEAAGRVEALVAARDQVLMMSVRVDDRQYQLGPQQIPFVCNVPDVLSRAYAIGRQGFPWMLGSDKTPFEVRYEHVQHTARNLASFSTNASYDKQALRELVAQIASQADRAPQDAMIESFDFNTKAFTVTTDAPGSKLDSQALYLKISEALDAGRLTEQISLHTSPLLPRITSVELRNSFTKLSSFSTQATRDQKRNTNIQLAARAVHGVTVMPGESFSFNGVVGARTAQKGYQMAPAIAGGVTFDEIGGGVCQVSSTLFNAAAMADKQIIQRSPHAWPSSYVEQGRDATVNWPNLDFEFKNPKATPVFIVASFQNQQMLVEIYGLRETAGESIQLRTQLVSTTQPPTDAIFQLNPTLAPGTQKVLKKARPGYLVDTYRVYLRGDQVYREEKLFSSNYRMVQQVIEYN